MGWGFAVIVDKTDTEEALNALEKAGEKPEQIGNVTNTEKIEILHNNKKMVLA